MIRLVAALLLASPAMAGQFQETPGLDRAVAAFTGKAIGDEGGARTAVDPRLRLAQCPTVALSWRTTAHDAVIVACSGPDWRIFVPVRMIAGTPAAPAPGQPLPVAAVKLPPVIKRGDPVTIEAGDQGFAISREGIAMGDAAPGARFMVKCDDAKAPVQAIAMASGRATLPGWGQ